MTNGDEDGLRIEWYENGQKKKEGAFTNGQEDGLFLQWYENGQKEFEGTYRPKKLKKSLTRRYKNTGISGVGYEMDGHWTFWYENGQRLNMFFEPNGKQRGAWKRYELKI